MEGCYGVFLGREQVGKVQVMRQGLYYSISCHCKISGEVVFRLKVICGDKQENLGVLIPEAGGFGLHTKIPAKRLGEGEPEFFLSAKQSGSMPEVRFAPIYPDEPFAYITRLKESYLVRKNGTAGILLNNNAGA